MGAHHNHDHCHRGAGQGRIAIAAILTGAFMIVEIAGGLISGSLALLADAGHMLTDFAALSLAWTAFYLARRPATSTHTFGFERMPVLAAFVNGLSLFAIAVWIVIEAIERFQSSGEILAGPMLYVAIAGLIVNIIVFQILRGGDRDNLNVRGALLHVMGDMLGSAAAIIAALVILQTGYTPIDPLLSVLVAILILRSAWMLIKDSGHILLQGAPSALDRDKISSELMSSVTGIQNIVHMHIWSLTDERVMITLEVKAQAGEDPASLCAAIKTNLAQNYSIDHSTVEVG